MKKLHQRARSRNNEGYNLLSFEMAHLHGAPYAHRRPSSLFTTLIGEPISESIETSGAKLHQPRSRGKEGYQLGALVVIARRRSSLFRTPAGDDPIDENVKNIVAPNFISAGVPG
jgi:hypothetical protein